MAVCLKCRGAIVDDRCSRCGEPVALSVAAPGLVIEHETAPGLESRSRRTAAAYLALQPSETAVLAAASRIFAGFITSGVVTEDNENDVSDRSVRLATRMALVIEKYVQSDSEDW